MQYADTRSTDLEGAAHLAGLVAERDYAHDHEPAPVSRRHTCGRFVNSPECSACEADAEARVAALDSETEKVLAEDEALSDLISCAVSCTARKTRVCGDGKLAVIPQDTTGSHLLSLFRDRSWSEFGEELAKDIAHLARREAERRLERAA